MVTPPGKIAHSIIIPTANHPDLLVRSLDSLQCAAVPAWGWEVLVMDNSDESYRAQNRQVTAGFSNPAFRYVPMTRQGLMFARHEGVDQVRGEIISFIDDDTFVSSSWLVGVPNAFADPQVGLVTGPVLPHFESAPPAWLDSLWMRSTEGRFLGFLSLLDFGQQAKNIPAQYAWGCNYSIRREAFCQAKGSHPDYLPPPLEGLPGRWGGGSFS
jgi:glycosyltransferase involved in cell wall biosynthesis